jgi:hypothetical protein
VNAEFLTEQVSVASSSEDARPTELVANLVDRIYGRDDLLATTAGHDLNVAVPSEFVNTGDMRKKTA